tara:strand:+ start:599 stop:2101 length:1503 start_codon:yes stop_codon:yes gene_type:complete
MEKIIIIGGGAAGMLEALELANHGYSITIIEKNKLGLGSSGRNPGRMGHGFHYTDVKTALAYLHASIKVQKKYPGFLIGQELDFSSPIRHGRYIITKDSNVPKARILETYDAIKAEYTRLVKEDPSNEVFGPPERFYRILPARDYQNDINMSIVDTVVETAEHLFDWSRFNRHLRELITAHPKITLHEHTLVTKLSKGKLNEQRFKIQAEKNGELIFFDTDFLINATWQEIEALNDQVGVRMLPHQRSNRLKTLVEVKLPDALLHTNSMFFCMGQHCMMSNMGNGRAMMTYAKTTNMEASTALNMSKRAQRLLDGHATQAEKDEIAASIIAGVSEYIPAMKDAQAIDVKFGIVQTKGKLSLEDLQKPEHIFNIRDDHGIRSECVGLISTPCMKLFYMQDNAEITHDLVKQHIVAHQLIKRCINDIKEQVKQQAIPFDKQHHKIVLEQLERYGVNSITADNIPTIVTQVLNHLKQKRNLISFFSQSSIDTTESRQVKGLKP